MASCAHPVPSEIPVWIFRFEASYSKSIYYKSIKAPITFSNPPRNHRHLNLPVDTWHHFHWYHFCITLHLFALLCKRFTSVTCRNFLIIPFFWFLILLTLPLIIFSNISFSFRQRTVGKCHITLNVCCFWSHICRILQRMVSFPLSSSIFQIPMYNDDCVFWDLDQFHFQNVFQLSLSISGKCTKLNFSGQANNDLSCAHVTSKNSPKIPSLVCSVSFCSACSGLS